MRKANWLMSLTLHIASGSTATIPHAVIEEAGLPYLLKELEPAIQAEFGRPKASFVPTSRIPALEDDRLVVFETDAIVLHLLSKPQASFMMPRYGSPEGAKFLQWLCYMSNSPRSAILEHTYPERWCRDEYTFSHLREQAARKLAAHCDLMDANVADGTFLPHGFSALDIYLTELARWSAAFDLPIWKWKRLEKIINATRERDGYRRMLDLQKLSWPTDVPDISTWQDKIAKYWH